jgi:tetratricopeptide (TPR) repeat protein
MSESDSQKAIQFKNEGNEYFKKKEYQKAVESYTKAINLNPMDPSYYGNRAASYLGMKKYNKCIDDCNETLNIDPNFGKALMRKGRAYFCLGDLKVNNPTFCYLYCIGS